MKVYRTFLFSSNRLVEKRIGDLLVKGICQILHVLPIDRCPLNHLLHLPTTHYSLSISIFLFFPPLLRK